MVSLSSATSSRPSALNHGEFSQLKPSPKVLSGATTYQWQATSGASTEHCDQSACHCGTCTHITAARTTENRLCSMAISFKDVDPTRECTRRGVLPWKGLTNGQKKRPFLKGARSEVRDSCIQREISALSSQLLMTKHDSTRITG